MTNFKIPKNGNSMMPFNFGPKDNDVRNSGWYRDVSMLIVHGLFPNIWEWKASELICKQDHKVIN